MSLFFSPYLGSSSTRLAAAAVDWEPSETSNEKMKKMKKMAALTTASCARLALLSWSTATSVDAVDDGFSSSRLDAVDSRTSRVYCRVVVVAAVVSMMSCFVVGFYSLLTVSSRSRLSSFRLFLAGFQLVLGRISSVLPLERNICKLKFVKNSILNRMRLI